MTLHDASGRTSAHLEFWTMMGTGSMMLDNGTLTVKAAMTQRFMQAKCRLTIRLRESREAYVFKNFHVTAIPDLVCKTDKSPANAVETALFDVSGVTASGEVELDISSHAQIIAGGVSTPKLAIKVTGGSVTIHEGGVEHIRNPLPAFLTVDAKQAMVKVQAESRDVLVRTVGDALDNGVLVSAYGTKLGEDHLLTVRKGPTAGWTDMTVACESSTFYVIAADKAHRETKPRKFVLRGKDQSGRAQLLPAGTEVLGGLRKWLIAQKAQEEKDGTSPAFIIFFRFLAPGFPAGTLRLLSSASYTAFSNSLFTSISGGMMAPVPIRIELPITVPEWLFPRLNHTFTKKEQQEMGLEIFHSVEDHVKLHELGYPKAAWVWDPVGPSAFLFDFVPATEHLPAEWKISYLGVRHIWKFLVAAMITLLLGCAAGVALFLFLVVFIRPIILDGIRHENIAITSTYSLTHTFELSTWIVQAAFVHWPSAGVILRWSDRPMGSQFASYSFISVSSQS
jgi:hypothetical protein